MKEINLGIIRETKDPPDRRVPLTPDQCVQAQERHKGLRIIVQPSDFRCFADEEYRNAGIALREDLSGCDVLMGIKEVKTSALIDRKIYLFFSHTAKKQPYNRQLLKTIVNKGIRLIDYEYLTGPDQVRLAAFGRWAGIVGAYHALRARGMRTGTFELPSPSACRDLEELRGRLRGLDMGSVTVAVTGGGRVAGGAVEILEAAGIRQVQPDEYLKGGFTTPVFTRLDPWHYTRRRDGSAFDFDHFVAHPDQYENCFRPYAGRTGIYIACHFWDPRSPALITREDLAGGTLPVSVIADVSCDINGPIASTIRASTIADPYYGYDPLTGLETLPFRKDSITVMAVDNLPGELPRDTSEDFGSAILGHVIPELLSLGESGMLRRASIAEGGKLTEPFKYLQAYLDGLE